MDYPYQPTLRATAGPCDADDVIAELPPANTDAIPELADHWRQLDLREILRRPAAFVSIGQSNSCYRPAFARINEFFAPVISTDEFVDLLQD